MLLEYTFAIKENNNHDLISRFGLSECLTRLLLGKLIEILIRYFNFRCPKQISGKKKKKITFFFVPNTFLFQALIL